MAAKVKMTIPVNASELDLDLFVRIYWDGSIEGNQDRCAAENTSFTVFPGFDKLPVWNPVQDMGTDGVGLDGLGNDGIDSGSQELQAGDGFGEDGIILQDGVGGNPELVINFPGIFRDGTYKFRVVFLDGAENESAVCEQSIDVKGALVRPPTNFRIKSLSSSEVVFEWTPSPDLEACS